MPESSQKQAWLDDGDFQKPGFENLFEELAVFMLKRWNFIKRSIERETEHSQDPLDHTQKTSKDFKRWIDQLQKQQQAWKTRITDLEEQRDGKNKMKIKNNSK